MKRFDPTSHQERLWFIDKFEKGYLYDRSPVYHNVPVVLEITGTVDISALQQSIAALPQYHEALKVRMVLDGEQPYQTLAEASLSLDLKEVSAEADMQALALSDAQAPFDLLEDALVRATLYQQPGGKQLVSLVAHHLIVDRYSIDILLRDLLALYEQFSGGLEGSLAAPALQYLDFGHWQKNMPPALRAEYAKYWQKRLGSNLQPLRLPADFTRAYIHIYEADQIAFDIPNEVADAIQNSDYFDEEQALFLAAYVLLLQRYANQEEIVVGFSSKNRIQEELINTLGPIANLLTIKTEVDSQQSFGEFFQAFSQSLGEAVANEGMPFDELVKMLKPDKDMSRTALFDVLFQFEEESQEQWTIGEATFQRLDNNYGWGKNDFNLLVKKKTDGYGYQGYFTYNKLYYRKESIEGFVGHYLHLLQNLLTTADQPLQDYPVFTTEQGLSLTESIHQKSEAYTIGNSVPEVFGEMVAQHGDRPAVSYGSTMLTYRELDAASDRVKNYLLSQDLEIGELIGLHLKRSEQIAVVMLGVLKAACSYLPFDTSMPLARKDYVVENSGIRLLLTDTPDQIDFEFSGQIIDIQSIISQDHTATREVTLSADLPAYVIYTSGTTGQPKGVNITQSNLLHLLAACALEFDYNENDVWSMFHSYNFDFTVWELYGALLSGGKVVICHEESRADSSKFAEEIAKEGITLLSQTPSSFYNLLQYEGWNESLRYVVFGGESLAFERIREWHSANPQVGLVNMYGITETTVHTSFKQLTEADFEAGFSNIGKPLSSHRYYILNEGMQLQPKGAVGELYVGGPCVSGGYRNLPEKNAERFLANPFQSEERLYRTGDLVRLHESRELEYIGRSDGQVQLRGYRIELGEIASTLDTCEGVKGSHVMLRERTDGDAYLCAYYVSTSALDTSVMRAHLSNHLPTYMLPSYYVHLQQLPLTINGKIDEAALPLPDVKSGEDHEAPANELETALVKIWSEILDHPEDSISVTKSFFELGGHSLRVAVLSTQINKQFGQKLPLAEVFKHPTVRLQAGYLQSAMDSNDGTDSGIAVIPVADVQDRYPLSGAQERMYLLQEMNPNSTVYNMPFMMRLPEQNAGEKVAQILQQIVDRHDSFRTRFFREGSSYYQEILKDVKLQVNHQTWKGEKSQELLEAFVQPFNLSEGPLVRCTYLADHEGADLLLLDMHHIISDGLSQSILRQEFETLWSGDTLQPLSHRYVDYAVYQQSETWKNQLAQERQYWEQQLTGELPHLDMPLDKPRPRIQSNSSGVVSTTVGKELTEQLRTLAEEKGVTAFMLYLSAWKFLLSRYSNQEEVLVGIPVSGRRQDELANIVGMFVNTLVIRSYPEQDKPFADYLTEVREQVIGAYDHQDYPFDELVQMKQVKRDISRHPLIDTVFNYINYLEGPADEKEGSDTDEEPSLTTKFDLTFTVIESADQVKLAIEYCSDLFEAETVRTMLTHLIRGMETVVADASLQLGNIALVEAQEEATAGIERPAEVEHVLQNWEGVVARLPEKNIVIEGEERYTVQTMEAKANQIAHHLMDNGVEKGQVVGALFHQGYSLFATALGVMKVGAIFCPIDPTYPASRIEHIIRDSQMKHLLHDEEGFPENPNLHTNHIQEIEATAVENPTVTLTATDPAYLIYTSGTTGVPNGVLIPHRGLQNLCQWHKEYYALTDSDVTTKFAKVGFDASIWEIFPYLTNGITSCIVPQAIKLDIPALNKFYNDHGVTISFLPTPVGEAFMAEENHSLRALLVGGDKLRMGKPEGLTYKLYNNYGPSEYSVVATAGEILDGAEQISIGKAITNTQAYVVSPKGQALQPVGAVGELCVAGPGLANGYFHNPELTQKKFVPCPWMPGERMYRTGDLVRMDREGNLYFMGRTDNQVKVRGNRVELGEIEQQISGYEGIKNVLVKIHKETMICAYFTAEAEVATADLKGYLKNMLPDYMMPQAFMQLEEMPLTPNQKVDVSALPEPAIDREKKTLLLPQNDHEKALLDIWAEVLQIDSDSISTEDNFFDIGGNSMLIVQMRNKIQDHFEKEIAVVELFEFSTITQISDLLQQENEESEEERQEREQDALDTFDETMDILMGDL